MTEFEEKTEWKEACREPLSGGGPGKQTDTFEI
jgi:hypothetical protein